MKRLITSNNNQLVRTYYGKNIEINLFLNNDKFVIKGDRINNKQIDINDDFLKAFKKAEKYILDNAEEKLINKYDGNIFDQLGLYKDSLFDQYLKVLKEKNDEKIKDNNVKVDDDYNYKAIELRILRKNLNEVDKMIEEGLSNGYISRYSIQTITAYNNKQMLNILSCLNNIIINKVSRLKKIANNYFDIIDTIDNYISSFGMSFQNLKLNVIAVYFSKTDDKINNIKDESVEGIIFEYNNNFLALGSNSVEDIKKIEKGIPEYNDDNVNIVQKNRIDFDDFINIINNDVFNDIKLFNTFESAEQFLLSNNDINSVLPDNGLDNFLEQHSKLYEHQIEDELQIILYYKPNKKSKDYLNDWINKHKNIILNIPQ